MKTLKLITLSIVLFLGAESKAQVSVNVNLGVPTWGPSVTTEEYYYLPDVNSYYDIRARQFIYYNNGGWIRANQLAPRYRGYNLKGGNIIVLHDYHGKSPYNHYKQHKIKYKKGPSHYYKKEGNGNGGPKGHVKKGKKGKH